MPESDTTKPDKFKDPMQDTMKEIDKQGFRQARPFIIGIVALLLKLAYQAGDQGRFPFDEAEKFVEEFEKRNDITYEP